MSSSFHRVVAVRAWGKTVADVLGKTATDRVIRFIAFALALILAWLWQTKVDPTSDLFEQATVAALNSAAVVAAIFFGMLLLNLMYVVPEVVFREQLSQIEELTVWRNPRLTVEALNDGRPYALGNYQATISSGGDAMVNISGENRTICLLVRNRSALKAETVMAQLVELKGDNGASIRDSMTLHWSQAEPGEYWGNIGCGGVRTLMLFKETARGSLQLVGRVPPEYLNILLGGKVFSGKIAINEDHEGALEVNFVLNTEERQMTIVGAGPISA